MGIRTHHTYYILTTVAVPGWCDPNQRVFEPDGDWDRRIVTRYAERMGLKKSQWSVHKHSADCEGCNICDPDRTYTVVLINENTGQEVDRYIEMTPADFKDGSLFMEDLGNWMRKTVRARYPPIHSPKPPRKKAVAKKRRKGGRKIGYVAI